MQGPVVIGQRHEPLVCIRSVYTVRPRLAGRGPRGGSLLADTPTPGPCASADELPGARHRRVAPSRGHRLVPGGGLRSRALRLDQGDRGRRPHRSSLPRELEVRPGHGARGGRVSLLQHVPYGGLPGRALHRDRAQRGRCTAACGGCRVRSALQPSAASRPRRAARGLSGSRRGPLWCPADRLCDALVSGRAVSRCECTGLVGGLYARAVEPVAVLAVHESGSGGRDPLASRSQRVSG